MPPVKCSPQGHALNSLVSLSSVHKIHRSGGSQRSIQKTIASVIIYRKRSPCNDLAPVEPLFFIPGKLRLVQRCKITW